MDQLLAEETQAGDNILGVQLPWVEAYFCKVYNRYVRSSFIECLLVSASEDKYGSVVPARKPSAGWNRSCRLNNLVRGALGTCSTCKFFHMFCSIRPAGHTDQRGTHRLIILHVGCVFSFRRTE